MIRRVFPFQRFNAISILHGSTETLFRESDGWDCLYTCEDATADAWTAQVGPDLAADASQAVDGDTTGLNPATLGARTNRAAVSSNVGGFGGWRSNGTDKATISQSSFTIRLLVRPEDETSQRPLFWWSNFFGSGTDYYISVQHTSSTAIQLGAFGDTNASFTLADFDLDTWSLVDLYYQPGVGVTVRINGEETFMADATCPNVLSNGAAGDVGIACRGTTGTVPGPGRTIGAGIVPGDLGLARHQQDAADLGLYVMASPVANDFFPDSDTWDFRYLGKDATALTWAEATNDHVLTAATGQTIDVSTTPLPSFTLGDLANEAITTQAQPDETGGYFNSTAVATLASNAFTLRVIGRLADGDAVRSAFYWVNRFQPGPDYYFALNHTSGVDVLFLAVSDQDQKSFSLPVVLGEWFLLDIYYQPGVSCTARYNGVEVVSTGADWPDVTLNGMVGGIGIGGRDNGTAAPPDQTILGIGVRAGDLGLARHQTDATALGLFNASSDPLDITTTTLADGMVDDAYSVSIQAVNGESPYTWTVQSGSLPTGLVLTGSGLTAFLAGTPTTVGTFNFTLRVTDGQSATADQAFAVTVDAQPMSISTASLPSGTTSVAYSQTIAAEGGVAPYTWTLQSGSLPTGLSLGGETDLTETVSGTPTTAETAGFTIRVTDSAGDSAERVYSVEIVDPAAPLAYSTASVLPGATVGTPYTSNIAVTGGTGPFTWEHNAGPLPAGMSLDTNATGRTAAFSGTPTEPTPAGNPGFRFRCTDTSDSSFVQRYHTFPVTATSMSITTQASLPNGEENSAYSQSIVASGGTSPYTWSVSSGALPAGVTLSGSTTLTETLSGTPTTAGTYNFTLQITDDDSNTASQAFTLVVEAETTPALVITTQPTLPSGAVNQAYTQDVVASGGTGPYTWSLQSGALPAGITLGGATGTTETLSGTPTADGTANFTLRVTDSQSAFAEQSFTLSIAASTGLTGVIGTNHFRSVYWNNNIPFMNVKKQWFRSGSQYLWRNGTVVDGVAWAPGGEYTIQVTPGTQVSDITFGGQASLVSSNQATGRMVVNIGDGGDGTCIFNMSNGSGVDWCVRSDRISDYLSGDEWNPDYKSLLANMSCLRFMDLMQTNNCARVTTADRPLPTSDTWSINHIGTPVEILCQLANELGINPWFCISHQASDALIDETANVVLTNLDPQLTPYFELSNEWWNSGPDFQQGPYFNTIALNLWGASNRRYEAAAYRSAFVMERIRTVFGSRPFSSVLGTQTAFGRGSTLGWWQLELQVAEGREYANNDRSGTNPNHLANFFSLTGTRSDGTPRVGTAPAHFHTHWANTCYVNPNFNSTIAANAPRTSQQAFNDWFYPQVISELESLRRSDWNHAMNVICPRYGLNYIYYEGGSHHAYQDGTQNDSEFFDLSMGYLRSEDNANMYRRMLEIINEERLAAGIPHPIINFFTDVGPENNPFAALHGLADSTPRWTVISSAAQGTLGVGGV